MIRYLENHEKKRCRALWNEAFPEDSKEFTDYYFREKTRDNRILAAEEEGRIVSMLHRNPYRIHVRERIWECDYLVGAATAQHRRRQGLFRMLIGRALRDMYEERMPFCFLMPANEAVYRPFGFEYIYRQPEWELTQEAELTRRRLPAPQCSSRGCSGATLQDTVRIGRRTESSACVCPVSELAAWMERWLRKRYQVYTVRDEAYLRRLLEELKSEDGILDVLYHGDDIAGIRSEWGLGRREQRFLMAEAPYIKETGPPRPAIMARIVCLERFVSAVRLKEGTPENLLPILLEVEDPLIPSNHGRWRWILDRETSRLECCREMPSGARMHEQTGRWAQAGRQGQTKIQAQTAGPQHNPAEPVLRLTIAELTEWLFGYGVPEAAEPYRDRIETPERIFLDEVV